MKPTSLEDWTPHTRNLLQDILARDGYLDTRNAPEEWVEHARNMERDRNSYRLLLDKSVARTDRLFEQIEALKSGTEGACYTCEPVALRNRELEARIKELEKAAQL